jgi:hypothetical protein
MNQRTSVRELLEWIWKEKDSNLPFAEPSLAERLVLSALLLATTLTFRGLCATLGRVRVAATEAYQLLVVILLVLLSLGGRPSPRLAFAVLAYLVYEIVAWSIFDVFVEAKLTGLHGRRSELRSFLWAIYAYSVLAWTYALYYWSSGQILDSDRSPLPNVVAALYYSVITITTIGYGDYAPARSSPFTQLVVMSEPLVGIVLLGLYFAVLVSALAEPFRRSISGQQNGPR